jgi:hypothetical protein
MMDKIIHSLRNHSVKSAPSTRREYIMNSQTVLAKLTAEIIHTPEPESLNNCDQRFETGDLCRQGIPSTRLKPDLSVSIIDPENSTRREK